MLCGDHEVTRAVLEGWVMETWAVVGARVGDGNHGSIVSVELNMLATPVGSRGGTGGTDREKFLGCDASGQLRLGAGTRKPLVGVDCPETNSSGGSKIHFGSHNDSRGEQHKLPRSVLQHLGTRQ